MRKPPMSQCPTPFGEGDRDMGRCAPGTAAERRLGLRPCGSEFAYRCAPAGARVRRGRSHKHFIAPTTTVPWRAPSPRQAAPLDSEGIQVPARLREAVTGPLWAIFRRPPATCSSPAAAAPRPIGRQRLEVGPMPGIRRRGRRWDGRQHDGVVHVIERSAGASVVLGGLRHPKRVTAC